MGRPRKSGGEQLSSRLEARSMSQCDLAAKLGISETSVSRWLSGERTPSLEMAILLERELGIPVEDWLLPRTGSD